MPVYPQQQPILIHLPPHDDEVVYLLGFTQEKLLLSVANRIPNVDYSESLSLTHEQLGAAVTFIFEDFTQIDKLITVLEELKQVYNAFKVG